MALLGVLAVAVALTVAGISLAAPAPATPTITVKPPDPSASTSAGFSFAGEAGSTFECRLDATAYAACTSPKPPYTGLALGSHTFRVRALNGGKTSGEATHTWSIVVPATPTVTGPANPTNATAATFTFTTNASNATFECQLDGGGFASCVSPKNYPGPLAAAPHTFQVRAVGPVGSSTGTSPIASFPWTVDLTTPSVMSINRANASPTSGSSVQWTVKFTEPVTGVDASDFTLVKAGLGGTPGISGVSGSGDTYTLTGSTGSGSGTLGLNLADNDSIKDLAGNALGGTGSGNGNFTGQVYTVDRTPPATPVLTVFPPDPSTSATSHFAWTDATPADVDHYECSKENGSFQPCPNPLTYAVQPTNNGQHQFSVRAIDAAGNISGSASYSWKVGKGSAQEFTISGTVSGLMIGVWKSIPITITNPNADPISVTILTVAVSGSPNGCNAATNFETQPAVVPFTVPANAVDYAVPPANQPQIRLKNLPGPSPANNQDNCKNQTINLAFSGSANGP